MARRGEARRNKKREKVEEDAKKQEAENELMLKYQEDDDITPKKAYNLAGELMVKAGWSAYKYEMEFSEKREKRKKILAAVIISK